MRKPRVAPTLAQKFFFFFLLASVFPLFVVGWFALDLAKSAIQEQVSNYTQQLMLEETHYMELLMREVESLIANVSTIDEIKQAVASDKISGDDYNELVSQAHIGYILSGYTHLRGLVSIDIFVGKDERSPHYHVGDTLNVQGIRSDILDAAWKRALAANGQTTWLGVADNVNANSKFTHVTTAARILYNTDPNTLSREPGALLLVNLDPLLFYEHFQRVELGPGAYLVLVDGEQHLVSHPDSDFVGTQVSANLLSLLPGDVGSQVVTLDGTPMFVSYSRSLPYDWRLIGFIPLDVLTARANSLSIYLVLLVAAILLFVSFAATVMVRNTVSPIKEITRRFKILRDGRLDLGLRMSELRHDELGELARGFNLFLDSLLAKRKTEQELRESEERYMLAVRGANDGLWDWNLKTDRVYYSPRWKAMLGYVETELGETPEDWFTRILPEDLEGVQNSLQAHIRGETPHFECEYRIRCSDGEQRWMLSRGMSIRDANGKAYRIAGSQTDITARVTAQQQFLHDARHDALTGLPNRTLFMERLGRLHENFSLRDERPFALLFLDLDRFKVVNDSLGHLAGDRLLIAMARRIENCMRTSDMLARLGGDEFGILLEDVQSLAHVKQVASRLLYSLARPYMLDGREISATASIGIALADAARELPEELLRDADTALYRAKGDGRSRFIVFDTEMHTRALAQLELEADLRRAVEHEEFEIFYQPIVSLETGQLTRLEALLRWQHPARGLVPPSEFISMVEETGLIVPLGAWCLRNASRQAQAWHLDFGTDFRVSINLSARQFQDQNLAELTRIILMESGLSRDMLEVEITERTAMRDLDHTIRTLNELHRMGVHISIDDFGESYSALGYLKRFPIDSLKIDRSFITDVVTNPDAAAIASALMAMAHQLSLTVVAEGVENEYQAAFLRSIQCDEVQGYIVGPPVPASAVPEFLTKAFLRELPVRLPVQIPQGKIPPA